MAAKRKPGVRRGRSTKQGKDQITREQATELSLPHREPFDNFGKAVEAVRKKMEQATMAMSDFIETPPDPIPDLATHTVGENEHGWHVYINGGILCRCKTEANAQYVADALNAYCPPDGE